LAIAHNTDKQKFPLVKFYCEEISAKYVMKVTDGKNILIANDVVLCTVVDQVSCRQ